MAKASRGIASSRAAQFQPGRDFAAEFLGFQRRADA